MTVGELRTALFNIEDQDAEIYIITNEKYGEIISTREIVGHENSYGILTVGHATDIEGCVSI